MNVYLNCCYNRARLLKPLQDIGGAHNGVRNLRQVDILRHGSKPSEVHQDRYRLTYLYSNHQDRDRLHLYLKIGLNASRLYMCFKRARDETEQQKRIERRTLARVRAIRGAIDICEPKGALRKHGDRSAGIARARAGRSRRALAMIACATLV